MPSSDYAAYMLKRGDRLIDREEVTRITSLPTSSIYDRIRKDPEFPNPIKIGPGRVAWLESEVLSWAGLQVERSRGGGAACA